jgi:hypothetical protein
VSYATPSTFREFGLPPGALQGVEDVTIQAHLDAAQRQIHRRLRSRNVTVPVTGDATADLAPEECKLAAYTILTLYRGVPRDDPSAAGYRELAQEALEEVDKIAEGIINLGAAPAGAGGGGLIQAIPAADADGVEEPDWWA